MSTLLASLIVGSSMRVKHQFERKLSADRNVAVVNIVASAQCENDIATAVGYHLADLTAQGFQIKSMEPTLLAASNSNQVTFTSRDPQVVARFIADNVEVLPDRPLRNASAPSQTAAA